MVNSAQPMNTDALMHEAIRRALELTTENGVSKGLSKQDRLDILKETEPLWAAQLPGHPGFVRQVFSTAAKVVNGELKFDTAKRFLFSAI